MLHQQIILEKAVKSHWLQLFLHSPTHKLAQAVFVILFLSFIPSPGNAQTFQQLDNLIFEPVPLDTQSGEEISLPETPYLYLSELGSTADLIASNSSNEEGLSSEVVSENIRNYQEQLDSLINTNGPFSSELFQTLIDLGTQHQLLGAHEEAIEIFERAEYISRINEGLTNPDQFVSIEKSIESHIALGDIATANQKQVFLLFQRNRIFGASNLGTLPNLVTMARNNMESYNRIISSPVQPTFSLNMGNSGFGGNMFDRPRNANPKALAFGSLYVAQQNYYQAIATMIDNKEYFNPLLLDLEYKFLETLFLQTFRSSILEDSNYYLSETRRTTGSLIGQSYNRRYSMGYSEGKNVFNRMLIYIGNNPDAEAFELADALMEFGDWNVLFNRGFTGRKKYKEAWELMQEYEVEPEALNNFFRPIMPVHLPRFTAKPNSREKFNIPGDAELPYIGYIDIAFTISKYGRAKRFEILDKEGSITSSMESRLRRFLRNSPFRPRLDNEGESVADRVTLRYYVAYANPVS